MKYKDELIRSMEWLADKDDTIFIGQSVLHSGLKEKLDITVLDLPNGDSTWSKSS